MKMKGLVAHARREAKVMRKENGQARVEVPGYLETVCEREENEFKHVNAWLG